MIRYTTSRAGTNKTDLLEGAMFYIIDKKALNPTVTRKTVPAPLIAKKMEQG